MGTRFCNICGKQASPSTVRCAQGHEQSAGTKYCFTCGSPTFETSSAHSLTNVPPTPVASPTNTYFPSQPPSKSRTGLIVGLIGGGVGLVVLVLLILVPALEKAREPKVTTVSISLTLYGVDSCFDVGLGYLDVPGSDVVVSVDGVPQGFDSLPILGSYSVLGCEYEVFIPDVSSEGESYSVEIGRRGTKYYSRDEMIASDWTVDLSLGL